MRRQRRLVSCRTCGNETWTFDHEHISAECRTCAYRRQVLSDICDPDEAMWREDDDDPGFFSAEQFDSLMERNVLLPPKR